LRYDTIPLIPYVRERRPQQSLVLGRIEPTRRAGGMRKWYERHTVALEPATNQLREGCAPEVAFDRQSAHQQDRFRLNEGQLGVEPGTAKGDLGLGGAPISRTAGSPAGIAPRYRGHVDVLSELILFNADRAHPPEQLTAGSSGKGAAGFQLGDTRCLADQHDAVVRVPTQDRCGLWQVTGIDAPGAGEDLGMEQPPGGRRALDVGRRGGRRYHSSPMLMADISAGPALLEGYEHAKQPS